MGTLRVSLVSAGFPAFVFTNIREPFDDSLVEISFSLRINPLPLAQKAILRKGQTVLRGEIVNEISGLSSS
jgi:hypothetical protein